MHQTHQNDKYDVAYTSCKACGGGGVTLCFSCEGRGKFTTVSYGFTTSTRTCEACGGSGIKRVCEACEGKGYTKL